MTFSSLGRLGQAAPGSIDLWLMTGPTFDDLRFLPEQQQGSPIAWPIASCDGGK
eukprot:CAMPEP_0195013694 /NCGR_PEP_ID=MMETSP0326_2-20130528/14009_1 /TAXON_ID=2866 ORGANISM="Crypthecodinium cohnii, Strain Seligo" /NCGR_SAMPLE_ID=MMETSP0326_2 /ASSEMBLY_ACC=CAM_ASM_000348 /LENGTH=53 /DNA_ID=CAMNT_0040024591 /DNA_START=36 /DNA_END=194 /DNA_ORIENTATION=+